MAFEDVLSRIVVAITAWVVQVENGGLLNIAFYSVPNGSSQEFEMTSNFTSRIREYILHSLVSQRPSLDVLKSMPAEIGGGRLAVEKSHAYPNREATIVWLTVASFAVILSVVIGMWIFNYCLCCGHRAKSEAIVSHL